MNDLQNKTAIVRPSLTILSKVSSSMSSIYSQLKINFSTFSSTCQLFTSSFSKWLNNQWRISSSSIRSPSNRFGSCFSKKIIVGNCWKRKKFPNVKLLEKLFKAIYIFDSMFSVGSLVVNFDKLNSMLVAIIVNLLQLFYDLLRVIVVLAILKFNGKNITFWWLII